jgi:hypothetical protein
VTKHFCDQGWSGINSESQPHFRRPLVADRTRDVNLDLAVGTRTGAILLTIYLAQGPGHDQRGRGASPSSSRPGAGYHPGPGRPTGIGARTIRLAPDRFPEDRRGRCGGRCPPVIRSAPMASACTCHRGHTLPETPGHLRVMGADRVTVGTREHIRPISPLSAVAATGRGEQAVAPPRSSAERTEVRRGRPRPLGPVGWRTT